MFFYKPPLWKPTTSFLADVDKITTEWSSGDVQLTFYTKKLKENPKQLTTALERCYKRRTDFVFTYDLKQLHHGSDLGQAISLEVSWVVIVPSTLGRGLEFKFWVAAEALGSLRAEGRGRGRG